MPDLMRLVMDILAFAWPFRKVYQWQVGLYYFCGRYQGEVGPGLKLIVPYFCDVKTVSVVPAIYQTPMQTITLRDGRHLTYSASITARVTNGNLAYNTLDNWNLSIVESVSGVLSEGLASADPDRFDPARGKRDRFLDELRDELNAEIGQYGLVVDALRFNNFAVLRAYRLIQDRAVMPNQEVPA